MKQEKNLKAEDIEGQSLSTFGLIHSLFLFSALNNTRVDALINILEEKGVLTKEEYDRLFYKIMREQLSNTFKLMEADAGIEASNITIQPNGQILIEGKTIAFVGAIVK